LIGDQAFLDADDEEDIVYVGCATIGLPIRTSLIETLQLLTQIAKLRRVAEKESGSMLIVTWMQRNEVLCAMYREKVTEDDNIYTPSLELSDLNMQTKILSRIQSMESHKATKHAEFAISTGL
jgi:hypothetical protein